MAGIERAVAQHPWSLAQFLNSCRSETDRVWVLQAEGGCVAGFAVCQLLVDGASLLNIAVLPDHQGKTHATALLKVVLDEARSAGATRCLLEVRRSNSRAIALYKRHGFTEDGVRKNYYPIQGGREDALLMSLNLVVSE